ncbi:MAG: nucleotidyltransferase domain-containing protein [Halobacteria archaeon]
MKAEKTHGIYQQTLRRWGGSYGVVLPKSLARALREGHFYIYPRGNSIVLSRDFPVPFLGRVTDQLRRSFGDNLLLVQLFGSMVNGRFKRGRSDVDLFIVLRRRQPFPLELYDRDEFVSFIDWPLERVVRAGPSSRFLREVKKGITLYGDPSLLP